MPIGLMEVMDIMQAMPGDYIVFKNEIGESRIPWAGNLAHRCEVCSINDLELLTYRNWYLGDCSYFDRERQTDENKSYLRYTRRLKPDRERHVGLGQIRREGCNF